MVHDLEARPVLAAGILEVVDGRQVHEHVESEVRLVSAEPERVDDALGSNHGGVVPVLLVGVKHPRTEAPAQPREDGRSVHARS